MVADRRDASNVRANLDHSGDLKNGTFRELTILTFFHPMVAPTVNSSSHSNTHSPSSPDALSPSLALATRLQTPFRASTRLMAYSSGRP